MESKIGDNEITSEEKVRVFIVDDHPVVREGLTMFIEREPDFVVCGESDNAFQAFKAIKTLRPDVITVDLSLGGKSGLDLIGDIARKFPAMRMLVLSMFDEMIYAERAVRAGARGYIMKHEATKKVLIGIRQLMAGKLFLSDPVSTKIMYKAVGLNTRLGRHTADLLTDRELETLSLLGSGYNTRQISEKMRIGFKTVETYRARIKTKLGFETSAELVQYAVKWVMERNEM
ncbi:MAG: response regulator [Candidatus Anammoxibacter sp.]